MFSCSCTDCTVPQLSYHHNSNHLWLAIYDTKDDSASPLAALADQEGSHKAIALLLSPSIQALRRCLFRLPPIHYPSLPAASQRASISGEQYPEAAQHQPTRVTLTGLTGLVFVVLSWLKATTSTGVFSSLGTFPTFRNPEPLRFAEEGLGAGLLSPCEPTIHLSRVLPQTRTSIVSTLPRCRDESKTGSRHHIHQQSQRTTGSFDIEFAFLDVTTRKNFHGARSWNLASGAATLWTIPAVVQIQSRLHGGPN